MCEVCVSWTVLIDLHKRVPPDRVSFIRETFASGVFDELSGADVIKLVIWKRFAAHGIP